MQFNRPRIVKIAKRALMLANTKTDPRTARDYVKAMKPKTHADGSDDATTLIDSLKQLLKPSGNPATKLGFETAMELTHEQRNSLGELWSYLKRGDLGSDPGFEAFVTCRLLPALGVVLEEKLPADETKRKPE